MKALIISLMIFASSLGYGCAIRNKMVANANTYTEIAQVYEVEEGGVTFITKDGNLWKVADFHIDKDKEVRLTFDMNGTYNITDDIIINIERI